MLYLRNQLCTSLTHPISGHFMKVSGWPVLLLAPFAMLLSLAGCGQSGPKLHPVRGTVMVNKKPAPEALVFFHRKGRTNVDEQVPFGKADKDGNFKVMNGNSGEGAPEGDYVITVYWPDMSKPEDSNGGRPDALNGAYEKVQQSKLGYVVKAGQNTVPTLELVPGASKGKAVANPNDK